MRIPFIVLLSIASTTAVADDVRSTELDVRSSAFEARQPIPIEYTCEGANVAPPLSWSNVPKGTRSLAILVDDPDAPKGQFTHWLVTGIPASTTSLDRGLPANAFQAKNDKGATGYTGPCPPSGEHRYNFYVYALDIDVPNTTSRQEFFKKIRGHVLAEGKLTGTYRMQR